MRFKLMGPRGPMEFEQRSDAATVSCVKCKWWIDYLGMAKEEVQQLAVYHQCAPAVPPPVFACYTIRPERPAGRRTA